MLSNGNSFGASVGNDCGESEGCVPGSRPPSWWFLFPADPRWVL